uniref:Putative alpha/beta hydrolase fold protein n=1 Tax=Microbacterium sp. MA1 TaxID=614068 RepID=C3UMZ7_9MICO|nr:putative alpha/beta hydrolase fold protein [Microbacterium sp. MA1]
MVAGSIVAYESLIRYYASATGVPFLAVDYRLAPEVSAPTPTTDAWTALRWLHDSASSLQIDAQRIAVMGDSAGGGIAAGVAIIARDEGLPLTKQILIYPMLDDRTVVEDVALAPLATWTYENNRTGWEALLGAPPTTIPVPPIAAPARLNDHATLAPAYIETGELDIFRDEDIDYARALLRAGVSCELHVHPGAPHGFEWLNPYSAVSKRARSRRIELIQSL